MAKTVKFELDSAVAEILVSAIDIAIDRVSGSMKRAVVVAVKVAIQSHLDELRLAQVRVKEAISGQRPIV